MFARSTLKERLHAATRRPAESELPPSSPKSSSTPTSTSAADDETMNLVKRKTSASSVGVDGARYGVVRSEPPASSAA